MVQVNSYSTRFPASTLSICFAPFQLFVVIVGMSSYFFIDVDSWDELILFLVCVDGTAVSDCCCIVCVVVWDELLLFYGLC